MDGCQSRWTPLGQWFSYSTVGMQMSLLSRSMDGNNKPVGSYCGAASMINQDHCTLVYTWWRCGSPERGTRGGMTPIFFPIVQDVFGHWKKSYGNGISLTVAGLRELAATWTADERATSQMYVYTPKDDLCTLIMMEELEKALQETRRGKAPGLDGISPEILKLGGPKVKAHLLSLYNTCWQRQILQQDFKDALIVMICKRRRRQKGLW